jgi:hypothetical protein
MFAWFKKLKSIVARHQDEVKYLHHRITELEKIIKERTDIAVDVNFSGRNHVIVVGQYKNKGYIQTYALNTTDFHFMNKQLEEMEKYGNVRTMDVPPTFHATFLKR